MSIKNWAQSILKHGKIEGLLQLIVKANSEIRTLPVGSFTKVEWVLPSFSKSMPNQSPSAEVKLLNSIANIELLAIYMYWDTINTFSAPLEFYQDLSEIALQECTHLHMLIERMQELNFQYPFMPCVNSLQELNDKTENCVISRIIVTSIYSEGKALDNKDRLIQKFKNFNKDGVSAEILQQIINDEIGHLKNGVKWYKFFCDKENVEYTQKYWEVIKNLRLKHKKPFNEELRRLANIPKEWYEESINL